MNLAWGVRNKSVSCRFIGPVIREVLVVSLRTLEKLLHRPVTAVVLYGLSDLLYGVWRDGWTRVAEMRSNVGQRGSDFFVAQDGPKAEHLQVVGLAFDLNGSS